jgi:hypothetical protein
MATERNEADIRLKSAPPRHAGPYVETRMNRRLAALLLAVAALGGAGEARASASVSCSLDDRATRLELNSIVSGGGVGRGLVQVRGELGVKLLGAAADFRRIELRDDHLRHTWLNGRDLRLNIYHEREGERTPHGTVELVIETRGAAPGGDDEGTYRGTYALTVTDMTGQSAEARRWTARGRITCSAGH